MKTWKQCTLVGFMAIFVLAFVLGCGSGKKLSGTWEASGDPVRIGYGIEFSGDNFFGKYPNGNQREDEYGIGTYSIITDPDQIEFVLSNGRKILYSFSRTKNAIIIDGKVYRQK